MSGNVTRYGLISGAPISDTLEPYMDMTLREFNNTSAAVGSNRENVYGMVLPRLEAVLDYIRDDIEKDFDSNASDEFQRSDVFETIAYTPSETYNMCCENGADIRKVVDSANPPRVVAGLFAQQGAIDYVIRMRRISISCTTHKGVVAVPALYFEPKDYHVDRPLMLNDMIALRHRSMVHNFVYQDSTILDYVNAYSMDDADGLLKNGFNVSFYENNDHYKDIRSLTDSIAPYGEKLIWFKLCGWRAGSVRVMKSRIPYAEQLIASIGAVETLKYLRAGVSNIRDVIKFVKADIDPEMVAHSFNLGLQNPKMMKKLQDQGLDFGIMAGLLNG